MTTLYIAEFKHGESPIDAQYAPVATVPPAGEQTVAVGGSSTQSAAFGSTTKMVRLKTDTGCSVAFGDDPTATTDNLPIAAGETEYFAVIAGQKLAVIANASF